MKIKYLLIITGIICFAQASTGQKPEKKYYNCIGTDADKTPFKNVMIFIDDVRTTTTSDKKGFYKLKVSPGVKEKVILSYCQ